jgi:hypothetical protein
LLQQNQQPQTLQDCIDAVNAAFDNSGNDADNLANKLLGAAGAEQAMAEGASRGIQNASPSVVGHLMGFAPGVLAPTNAGLRAAGSTLQEALENADPYIKGAGKGVVVISVGVATVQGYQSSGLAGAAVHGGYATADAVIEGAMVDGLTPFIGIPLALGYDKIGGTHTVAQGLAKGLALQGCYAQGGQPLPNMAF